MGISKRTKKFNKQFKTVEEGHKKASIGKASAPGGPKGGRRGKYEGTESTVHKIIEHFGPDGKRIVDAESRKPMKGNEWAGRGARGSDHMAKKARGVFAKKHGSQSSSGDKASVTPAEAGGGLTSDRASFTEEGFWKELGGEAAELSDVDLSEGSEDEVDDGDDGDDGDVVMNDGEGNGSSSVDGSNDHDDHDDDLEGEVEAKVQGDEEAKGLVSEASSHKASLERLKARDPEFYAYLASNEKGLLEFDPEALEDLPEDSDSEQSDAESVDDDSDDEDAAKKAKKAKKAKSASSKTKEAVDDSDDEDDDDEDDSASISGSKSLTEEQVERWARACKSKKKPFAAMRELLAALKAASDLGEGDKGKKSSRYNIIHSSVYNKVLTTALRVIPEAMDVMCYPAQAKAGEALLDSKPPSLSKNKNWKKARPLAKSFLASSLTLLKQMTDENMTVYLLKATSRMLPYLSGLHDKWARSWLKTLLTTWSSGSTGPSARVAAALCLRGMALVLPFPFIELVLKGAVLAFTRVAQYSTPSARAGQAIMSASIVELFGLDEASSYSHAFVYIRTLAVTLRNALTARSSGKKDAAVPVLSGQFLACLNLWTDVLCAHAGNEGSQLKALVYPLTQLLYGAARFAPTARYYPMRLGIIRALNKLNHHTGVYIPVLGLLSEMFESVELRRRPKSGSTKLLDLRHLTKVSDGLLHTRNYQETVTAACLSALLDHFAIMSRSIAFPELAAPATVFLKRFLAVKKGSPAVRQASNALQKLHSTSEAILRARALVEFAPKDIDAVKAWKGPWGDDPIKDSPIGKFATLFAEAESRKLEGVFGPATGRSPSSGNKRGRDEDDESDESEGDDDEGEDDDEIPQNAGEKIESRTNGRAAKRARSKAPNHMKWAEMNDDEDEVKPISLSSLDWDDE